MNNQTYTPNPIDTSDVELSKDMSDLTELLAKNAHENWACGRIAAGWSYGETRDDQRLETPCLVPYEELSESEKEYDRTTALETIKVILKLGYRISK